MQHDKQHNMSVTLKGMGTPWLLKNFRVSHAGLKIMYIQHKQHIQDVSTP